MVAATVADRRTEPGLQVGSSAFRWSARERCVRVDRTPKLLAGVVAGPNEGSGLDVGDADLALTEPLPPSELVRVYPSIDGQVVGGRLQVLADRDDVHAGACQVVQGLRNLVRGLAHAEDQVRLGDLPFEQTFGDPEHLERATVAEGRTDSPVEPAHGLQVVREHVGFGPD